MKIAQTQIGVFFVALLLTGTIFAHNESAIDCSTDDKIEVKEAWACDLVDGRAPYMGSDKSAKIEILKAHTCLKSGLRESGQTVASHSGYMALKLTQGGREREVLSENFNYIVDPSDGTKSSIEDSSKNLVTNKVIWRHPKSAWSLWSDTFSVNLNKESGDSLFSHFFSQPPHGGQLKIYATFTCKKVL